MKKAREALIGRGLLVAAVSNQRGGRGNSASWAYSLNLSERDTFPETCHSVTLNLSQPDGFLPVNLSQRDTAIRKERESKEEPEKNSARPCLEEVLKYCKERGGVVDPQKWFDYYSANGWRVGRNPMKDWRAAVRTWERNGYSSGKAAQLPLSTNYDPVAELRRQNGTARIDRSREQPP